MLAEILAAKIKPKEKERQIIELLNNGAINKNSLIEFYQKANDSGRGYCMAVITAMTKVDKQFADDIIDFVIAQLDHKAGRVKWEAAEIVGLSAVAAPEKCATAIMPLLKNTEAEGTVARWSAAFALTEIALNNPAVRQQLLPVFEKIVQSDESNGVKKIYQKALKQLEKNV
ncbi:MAG: hypothetical protein WCP79_02525 [Bacillota bacterium]